MTDFCWPILLAEKIGQYYRSSDIPFRARCTNVVHDLGSAEPRSKVEPSSRCIALHQVELGSADPVQLNLRGYSVDDADWSSHAGQWAKHSDVTVTRNAYETIN